MLTASLERCGTFPSANSSSFQVLRFPAYTTTVPAALPTQERGSFRHKRWRGCLRWPYPIPVVFVVFIRGSHQVTQESSPWAACSEQPLHFYKYRSLLLLAIIKHLRFNELPRLGTRPTLGHRPISQASHRLPGQDITSSQARGLALWLPRQGCLEPRCYSIFHAHPYRNVLIPITAFISLN